MKHACSDGGYTEFTVNMSIADWDSMKFFYQMHDEDGNLIKDTVPSNCEDDGANRTCKLYAGNVPQWQELGLPSDNQLVMGWRNEAGDYGIRSKSKIQYNPDGVAV